MRAFLRLVLAGSLLASAACGSDATNTLESSLRGTWSEHFDIAGNARVMMLSVVGATVTGSGSFAGEAGPSGNLTVTGVVAGSHVALQIAQDDGTTLMFDGTVPTGNTLTGSFAEPGDTAAVTFERIQVDPH
jgi:hypothetical protein